MDIKLLEKIKLYYRWATFHEDTEILISKIKKSGKQYKNLYAIPRGGLILGVCLSHALNIPLLINPEDITDNTLIVDEICDTGGTLEPYMNKGLDTVVLWNKRANEKEPTYFVKETEYWIVFPWEMD